MQHSLEATAEDSALFGSSNKDRGRLLDTALHHANLIQAKKDTEARVLESIELLLEFPPSQASPEAVDEETSLLGQHLRLFRPVDFDELVKERDIIGKCGYVLCSNHNEKKSSSAKYRIIRARDDGLYGAGIFKTDEVERWCSNICQLKTRHLRAQLDDEPAWTRDPAQQKIISLPHTDASIDARRALEQVRLESKTRSNAEILASERGEASKSIGPERLLTIREKSAQKGDKIQEPVQALGLHDSIEGYKPQGQAIIR